MVELLKKYPKQVDAIILIFGFIIGANLFIFFKTSGMNEESIAFLFDLRGFHPTVPTAAGLIIGVAFYFLEFRFFKNFSTHHRPWSLAIKFVVFSIVIILTAALLQCAVSLLVRNLELNTSLTSAWQFIHTDIFFSLYVYLILLGITLNFFRELGNRFGHGIIFNYLSGKYREPVEENRVFMFLDLNRSTSIAEKLGHVKYSRFLKKCFNDLSEVLPDYDGEIYQYVGDEAVITWLVDQLTNPLKPVLLYNAFNLKLKENQSEYQEKFGMMPTFKAAINSGFVSVSMVGASRKEMAYHGDVLNTASRILEQCSKLKKRVLITESFSILLKGNYKVTTVYLKDLFLRGKKGKIGVYQPILHHQIS